MSELVLTSQNFTQTVQEATVPVLVDFWATWCGPCQMLAPAIAEIAEEYAGRAIVGKVNVDDEPQLAMMFGIQSIPTVLIFKGGKLAESVVGLRAKEAYTALLNQA